MKKMNLEEVRKILVAAFVGLDYDEDTRSEESIEKWEACVNLVDAFLGCGVEIRECAEALDGELEGCVGYSRFSKLVKLANERFGEILSNPDPWKLSWDGILKSKTKETGTYIVRKEEIGEMLAIVDVGLDGTILYRKPGGIAKKIKLSEVQHGSLEHKICLHFGTTLGDILAFGVSVRECAY